MVEADDTAELDSILAVDPIPAADLVAIAAPELVAD
jgi:hypothetical protein